MPDKIFGYEWKEIQAMQNGTYKGRTIPRGLNLPEATEHDIELLNTKGLEWLKSHRYYGTIDKLITSGYLSEELRYKTFD